MPKNICFGINPVQTLLISKPETVKQLLVQRGVSNSRVQECLQLATANSINFTEIDKKRLEKLAGSSQHQGIMAECIAATVANEKDLLQHIANLDHPALILVLDNIQDPHNFGACLRSCEAAGVDAVVSPRDKAVGMTPVVRKVASGAAETVPWFQVTNLARCLSELQAAGVWIYGAAGEASDSLYSLDLRGPCALVMGAEGAGMRRLTREHCDGIFKIPMQGSVESLNVSVATGICLFEARRQRS